MKNYIIITMPIEKTWQKQKRFFVNACFTKRIFFASIGCLFIYLSQMNWLYSDKWVGGLNGNQCREEKGNHWKLSDSWDGYRITRSTDSTTVRAYYLPDRTLQISLKGPSFPQGTFETGRTEKKIARLFEEKECWTLQEHHRTFRY